MLIGGGKIRGKDFATEKDGRVPVFTGAEVQRSETVLLGQVRLDLHGSQHVGTDGEAIGRAKATRGCTQGSNQIRRLFVKKTDGRVRTETKGGQDEGSRSNGWIDL